MKRYELSATDLRQYASLTEEEKQAWLNPLPTSYHSFHVERMGADTFRWRDSRLAEFRVGTHAELCADLLTLSLRKVDPDYLSVRTTIRTLTQEEVDDLLSDL